MYIVNRMYNIIYTAAVAVFTKGILKVYMKAEKENVVLFCTMYIMHYVIVNAPVCCIIITLR